MSTLFLCGAGNPEGVRLARRVMRHTDRWTRLAVLDDDPRRWQRKILGVPVLGGFDRLKNARPGDAAVNLVARTTRRRAAAQARIDEFHVEPASLVDVGVDSDGVALARGVTVYPGAHLGPETELGPHSVVFMGAIVGHECRVGTGVVIAANAVLNARVAVGDGAYIGTNATVLPEITVHPWATVGAGSVAVQDVPASITVLGVPAAAICVGETAGPHASVEDVTSSAPTPLELAMADIWRGVLGRTRVGLDQTFFDVGGDSLTLIRLANGIRRSFGTELTLGDLLRIPTVRGMASVVETLVLQSASAGELAVALTEVAPELPSV